MKLEVGMYVRDTHGVIEKIRSVVIQESNPIFPYTINCTARFGSSIEKASFNLIDLIEVGDFVNQQEILGFHIMGDNVIALIGVYKQKIVPEYIKEILTKEQYEANVYRVKED